MPSPAVLRASTRRLVDHLLGRHGDTDNQWCRLVMNRDISRFVQTLPPERCSAVEISGDRLSRKPWRSYERLPFPEFDLCSSVPTRTFDVVICEQVIEHVPDPWMAVQTLRELCTPGGHIVVSTPFLIRLHNEPADYWRFTADGLRLILERAGLDVRSVATWGNRSCVRANFRTWVAYRPWHSLRNEEAFPVVAWAIARRPLSQ